MFWKVGNFSAPSPIEQILDREEFSLEELLDEDDIIQECKSLNGRLVAFLRERSTVEQLVRYLVDPPLDADDPKRAFKYPFTACEVFCCDVEAVFNTLLEDSELMALLMSLLDMPPPLSSKTAGYFGRVIGALLLRKSSEVVQYLQTQPELLNKLVNHVDNVSIADIIKRLVGAEEPSSMLFIAQHAEWLADTPLVDLLLAKLAPDSTPNAQANAADILTAIAHTQPSPLASKLTLASSIGSLFEHALAPSQSVLVPALDVCIALVEPRRGLQGMDEAPMQDLATKAKEEAVDAILQHMVSLMELLQATPDRAQWLPYGVLDPPLGRTRLKVVELLAVLTRSGCQSAETAIMQTPAMQTCLRLFRAYPFNNLLHHCVVAMLVAVLTRASDTMLDFLFHQCAVLDWLIDLPVEVSIQPLPGHEEAAACKALLRAGYMGHVTQIAGTLEALASMHDQTQHSQSDSGPSAAGSPGSSPGPATAPDSPAAEQDAQGSPQPQQAPTEEEQGQGPDPGQLQRAQAVNTHLEQHSRWQVYLSTVVHPRQELENTSMWACGRPVKAEVGQLESEGDDFQAEMEMENVVGSMQPVMYHRYGTHDEDEEADEDEDEHNPFKASSLGAQIITEGISNVELNESNSWPEAPLQASFDFDRGPEAQSDAAAQEQKTEEDGSGSQANTGDQDDDVLLGESEDDDRTEEAAGSPTAASAPADG